MYGKIWFEHPSQNDGVKEKSKQTCMENLGCEYPMQNTGVKEKSKQTCMENFGCEYQIKGFNLFIN